MRTCLSVATLVAAVLAIGFAPQRAQAQGGTNVAVIDISEVFKKHQRFNQDMELLRKDAQAMEEQFKQRQQQVAGERKKLEAYAPGSPDFKRLEEQVAKMGSDLQVDVALKKKELVEREAKIYYNTYNEVVASIAEMAKQYQIGLVLRFDRRDIDPADEGSVMRGVNRAIVHHNGGLDITDAIIQQVNRGTPPAGANIGNRPQIPAGRR